MEILQSIVAFIILVGVLVFIHELGHFLAARWNGIRADVFAVGMGPRIMGWNSITGFTFGKLPDEIELDGRTDYRISAFPIGGYVKIAGMVDESMDTEFTQEPPKPWEFRTKRTWQKAFVISAGVIMNLLLAIVLFAGLAFFHGDGEGVAVVGPIHSLDSALMSAGIRTGDTVVAVNGQNVRFTREVDSALLATTAPAKLSLRRADGTTATVTLDRAVIASYTGLRTVLPPPAYVEVGSVPVGGPAASAGVLKGDTIVAVNGNRITSPDSLIASVKGSAGRPLNLTVAGAKGERTIKITPNAENQIGVMLAGGYTGPVERVTYPLGSAIVIGFEKTGEMSARTFELIANLFTGKANLKESVGGPILIAKVARQSISSSMADFLALMAILSVTLACMNILPIPALDGGHLVFIIIEAIIRREVPLKLRMAVQQVGFVLLLLFMAFVFYNDIVR